MALTLGTITGLSAAWLAAAMAGAVLTIAVHLLGRWRARTVVFPAQRFVSEIAIVARRRRMPRGLLLLAVRLLMIVALGLAFDRIGWATSRVIEGRGQDQVIVLDNSASMTRVSGNRSLFDRAQDVVLREIAEAERDDRAVAVIEAGVRARPLLPSTTRNYHALRARVLELAPSLTHANLGNAIEAAAVLQLLDGNSGPRRIVVISDMQATSVPADEEVLHLVGEWVSVSENAPTENIAVVDASSVVFSGPAEGSVRLHATVQSFAGSSRDVTLSLEIGGLEIGWKPVSVLAGGSAEVAFDVVTPVADFAPVRWRILEDDALAADNERWTALVRAPQVDAVIVTSADAFDGESGAYFSRVALAPADDQAVGVLSLDDLDEARLRSLAVVVVSPGVMSQQQIDALASEIRSGARVVFIADSPAGDSSIASLLSRHGSSEGAVTPIDGAVHRFVLDAIGTDDPPPVTVHRLGAGELVHVRLAGPLAESGLVAAGALPVLLHAYLVEGDRLAPEFVRTSVGESVTTPVRAGDLAGLMADDNVQFVPGVDRSGAPVVTLRKSAAVGLRTIRNADGEAVAVQSVVVDLRESELDAIENFDLRNTPGESVGAVLPPALKTNVQPLWPVFMFVVLLCACVEPVLVRRAVA